MYLSYYGLEFNPFDKEIETKYAFETEDFKILKNRLDFVKENKTMALITGNPGMGKTFVIRSFLNELNNNLYKVVYICMSTITTYEFYRQLCFELGIEPPFKKIDMFGQYGFYESYDYDKGEKVLSYFSHHQGMILASLCNYLKDNKLRNYFHNDVGVK